MLDRDDLARMAFAGATLEERMDAARGYSPVPSRFAERVIERWCERAADGNRERFRRRLAGDGWTAERARAALTRKDLFEDDPLPAWADLVADAVARAAASRAVADPAPCAPSFPFEEILAPFVAIGRERVEASPHARVMTSDARHQLATALLRRLAVASEQTLVSSLDAFAALESVSPDEARAAFIAHMRDGGLARVLKGAPVLARLLADTVANWADSVREMMQRVADDHALLRGAFASGGAIGRVCGVEADLSDPHRGGRTVCVLRFQSGVRVVYKPRPLRSEAAWQQLLCWLNDRDAGLALRTLAVADRGAYGWMEYAESAPCEDGDDSAQFNERAGALLCLAYALGGSDFHAANLIGCGAHPVLVDLEMMFGAKADPPRRGATGAHRDSVLGTGMVPQWVPGPGGRVRRQGGLITPGPILGGRSPQSVSAIPRGDAGRSADGRPPEDAARVSTGFTRMYRFLLRHRGELLAPNGPLAAFDGAEVRVLRRATWVYDTLLRHIRHPAYLSDGIVCGIEIDVLSRAESGRAGIGYDLRSERATLVCGDVPILQSVVDLSRTHPGHRLDAMGAADLAVQSHLIHLAFDGRPGRGWLLGTRGEIDRAVPGHSGATGRPGPVWLRAVDDDRRPIDFTTEAMAIAEGLLRTAIHRPDGSVTWIGPREAGRKAGFAPVGPALAHGISGIALFLALCGAVEGSERYRHAALQALDPLMRGLRSPAFARRLADRRGNGGAAGMGGIVYALTRAAALLGDDTLLAAAGHAARAIQPRADDERFDVYSGAAGAILGLLVHHRATWAASSLERAAELGQSVASAHSPCARGFAHGVSGLAHALLQLHRATGDESFLAAAKRFLSASTGILERPAERTVARVRASWCSGAGGIGLMRADGQDLIDAVSEKWGFEEAACYAGATEARGRKAVAFEQQRSASRISLLQKAITAVIDAPLQALDHPCCGNAGGIEMLLVAAARTGRAELRDAARDRAAALVRRARMRRSYGTVIEDRYTPGFFQGAAGIGYTLLRVADPDLPCVLLWE